MSNETFIKELTPGFSVVFAESGTLFVFNGRSINMESVLGNRGYQTYAKFMEWREAMKTTLRAQAQEQVQVRTATADDMMPTGVSNEATT